jgi:hypothetical protein
MGMFSWDCNGCGFAMSDCTNCSAGGWMGHAVCLTPDGSRVIGQYDHYGNLGSFNLVDQRGTFAIYHKACWELAGKPEYDRPARHSHNQGACLAIHGAPLPKPTSPEWFTVARTWEAFDRILQRVAKVRSEIEHAETVRLWEGLTTTDQGALCAAFEAEQLTRMDEFRRTREAWFDADNGGPMPEWEGNPKTFSFNGLTFNYAWLDVLVWKAVQEKGHVQPAKHTSLEAE